MVIGIIWWGGSGEGGMLLLSYAAAAREINKNFYVLKDTTGMLTTLKDCQWKPLQ